VAAAPRTSFLVPCRDAADTLDDALHSLVHQTADDFEVVIVDDGSAYRTRRALDAWATRDARIRIVRTARQGIVTALNRAAAAARGTIFARMDADDIAEPERLERQLALLDASPDLAACGTAIRYFPRRTLRGGARRYEAWINGVTAPDAIERDLFVECPLPHPTVVIRRDAFEAVGGYRDMGWPEDYDLVLRLWAARYRLGKVPHTLLRWRDGSARLSRRDARYAPEAFRRCKVHFLRHRTGDRPIVVWGAGPVGKAFARTLADAERTIEAFVDLDPRKIGQEIHGAPVIPPSAITHYRHAYVLAAVGQPPARAAIRRALHAAGFREPVDCCAVA
jgi:glycosyltransferase involved in cell wall biosynthesis